MRAPAAKDSKPASSRDRSHQRFSLTDDEIALSFSIYFTWGYPDYMREALQYVCDTWKGPQRLDPRKELTWSQLRKVIDIADSKQTRVVIASRQTTPPCVLNFLADSSDDYIVQRVAENSNTHVATLTRLVRHHALRVRISLSEHPALPEPLYAILSQDAHADIRFALAENFHVPTAVLETLAADENPYVAARAGKTLEKLTAPATVPAVVLQADFAKRASKRRGANASR